MPHNQALCMRPKVWNRLSLGRLLAFNEAVIKKEHFMRRWGSLFVVNIAMIVAIGFSSISAQAKEMGSRLGVGFRDAYSFDLPSLAAVYYPSSLYAVVGALGVDTQDNASKSAVSVGLRRLVFMEDSLNFFMGGQASMVSLERANATGTGYETKSGFELSALVGVEFFMAGLDNLGFNFETGVGIASIDKVRFRTLGDHMLRAGMFFYF